MKKTFAILSVVSLLMLGLVSCEDRDKEQQKNNPITHVLSQDSDKGDKGSTMPPDD